MKRLLLMMLLAMPLNLAAQDQTFMKFYKEYSGKKGYTSMELQGELIQFMGGNKLSDGKSSGLEGIEVIRLVMAEKAGPEFAKEVERLMNLPGFKLMTSINESSNQSRIYLKKGERQSSSEFLMIMTGNRDNLVMHITGTFDINAVSKLPGLLNK